MRNLLYKLLVFLILSNLSSCLSKKSETVHCYSKNYGTLLQKLNADFENQLETRYLKEKFSLNLKMYLLDLINEQKTELIIPSNQLRDEIVNSQIKDDIWLDSSINLKGDFIRCLKLSDNNLIKDYLDRLELVGDISPKVFAAVVSKTIETNQKIDQDLKMVIMVNYYLIGVE